MKLKKYYKFRYFIFRIVKQLVRLCKTNKCKIDTIEDINGEYFITFCYVGKRQIFVKSAHQIHKNKYLLKEFCPVEAAMIGVYAALTYSNMSKQMEVN